MNIFNFICNQCNLFEVPNLRIFLMNNINQDCIEHYHISSSKCKIQMSISKFIYNREHNLLKNNLVQCTCYSNTFSKIGNLLNLSNLQSFWYIPQSVSNKILLGIECFCISFSLRHRYYFSIWWWEDSMDRCQRDSLGWQFELRTDK